MRTTFIPTKSLTLPVLLALPGLIALLTAPALHAQSAIGRVEIGASVGGATGTASITARALEGRSDYDSDQTSWGVHAGVVLPDLLGPRLGLVARAAYMNARASHVHEHPAMPILLPNSNPDGDAILVDQDLTWFVEHESWRSEAEAMLRYAPVGELALTAGAAAGYVDWTSWKESYRLTLSSTDSGYVPPRGFASNGKIQTLDTEEELPRENHLSFAAIAGVAWTVRAVGVTLTPEFRLRYDLTGPADFAAWHPLSILGMISIGFDLNGSGPDR